MQAKTKPVCYTILVALLLIPLSAVARRYAVELIVFERFDGAENIAERWNVGANNQLKRQQQIVALSAQAEPLIPDGDVDQLAMVKDNLQQSGYRLLSAMRWTQPAKLYADASVWQLESADGRMRGYLRIYKTSLIFADLMLALKGDIADSDLATIEANNTATSNRQISTIPVFNTRVPEITQAPDYFINEKRRLKFGQVHYFDHPKYGAILAVWPAEEE